MRTAYVCFLLLAFAVASSQALKCFNVDCKDDCDDVTGSPETCSADKEICMKVVAGDHVARRCEKYELCSLGKVERAANRAWEAISNLFNEVDQDIPLVYCCDDDFCNSSNMGLPSIILTLLLSLLVVSFFKA